MGVNLIKAIDTYCGSPLCWALGMLKKESPLKDPKSIVFLQFWGVGESLLTLPTIKKAREMFPDAKITVLVTSRVKQVFVGHDFIDHIDMIETTVHSIFSYCKKNKKKFDLCINFEEYLNISSIISFFIGKHILGYDNRVRRKINHQTTPYNDQQHVVETHLDLLRILDKDIPKEKELVPFTYSEKDKKTVEEFMKKNNLESKKVIVLCPGVAESAKSRQWPAQNWSELAEKIGAEDIQLVAIGTGDEKARIEEIIVHTKTPIINTAGVFSLTELARFIEQSDIVVSNDSGPMHIGAAMKTKTIGLFGPNLPVRWKPFGKNNLWIYKGNLVCEMSPCINVHKGQVPECLQPHHNNVCMQAIDTQDVVKAIQLLQSL